MSFLGSGGNSRTPPNQHTAFDFSAFAVEEDDESPSDPPQSRAPAHESPSIPGGYDFEPQEYEGGAASRARSQSIGRPSPTSQSRPSRLNLSRTTSDYGQVDGQDDGDHAAARPTPLGWRTLLRFGTNGLGSRNGPSESGTEAESNRLLFSQDESDETDSEQRRQQPDSAASYPPRNIHLPLPPRPPTFAPPPNVHEGVPVATSAAPSSSSTPAGRVYGGGAGNDGVFSNLAAKPDGSTNADVVGEGPDKDEVLPAYEAAALDSTPPYWETTVITPGGFLGPDDICVDGMPVGNLFSFAWNLLVSMSFQFVGFLLTYLLHTTHAAKNGSRAGLGITLIQLGFYLKQHTDHSSDPLFDDSPSRGDETGLNGNAGPRIDNVRWSWWGGEIEEIDAPAAAASATLGTLPTQISNSLHGVLEASNGTAATGLPSLMGNSGPTEQELNAMSLATNEWMSFALVTVGSFLLIGGCLSYWRAVRYARAMRQGQGPGADNENMVAVS
ncbi:hypothetical protein JCM11491_001147 [Sporobolomyces phaffii]